MGGCKIANNLMRDKKYNIVSNDYQFSRYLSLLIVNNFISPPRRIVLFRYNHMYRTLANPKRLRRQPDRGIALDDIICNLNCTFLDIFLHDVPLRMFFTSYEGMGGVMPGNGCLQSSKTSIYRFL